MYNEVSLDVSLELFETTYGWMDVAKRLPSNNK